MKDQSRTRVNMCHGCGNKQVGCDAPDGHFYCVSCLQSHGRLYAERFGSSDRVSVQHSQFADFIVNLLLDDASGLSNKIPDKGPRRYILENEINIDAGKYTGRRAPYCDKCGDLMVYFGLRWECVKCDDIEYRDERFIRRQYPQL